MGVARLIIKPWDGFRIDDFQPEPKIIDYFDRVLFHL